MGATIKNGQQPKPQGGIGILLTPNIWHGLLLQHENSFAYMEDHLCFCVLCFSCFHVCSLLPCGHLLGKGWPLGSCWWCLLYFSYFPMWYPGSGVVLDCIVSWSLSSFLLSNLRTTSSQKTKQFIRINMLQHNKEKDSWLTVSQR